MIWRYEFNTRSISMVSFFVGVNDVFGGKSLDFG